MLLRKVLTAVGLVAALGAAIDGAAAQEPIQVRMSVESAPGAATQVMLAAFRDALQEEMGDAVEIEYFDGGTLGDEIVHMEMVRTGQLDVIPIGSDAVELDSKWAIFDMPFLFPDRETAVARAGRRDRPAAFEFDARERRAAGPGLRRDRLSQHHQQRPAGGRAGRPRRA